MAGDFDQIDFIIRDLAEYTRLEIVALAMNVDANLREAPPVGTPVDTGWAKANWLPSIGAPLILDSDLKDPTPAAVAARQGTAEKGLNDVLSWRVEDGAIFVTSSVPYIVVLNEGHSKQSPKGFVQAAIELAVRQTDARSRAKQQRNTRASNFRAKAGKPQRRPGK